MCSVFYLPPANSTRNIGCSDVLDILTCQIHEYASESVFYLCGDFNARISNLDDFIAGFDSIPDRHVVDFNTNKHGEILCEFLIHSNRCVLNGHNYKNNDVTQCASVVDYCIVPYEKLHLCDKSGTLLMPDFE